MQIALLYNVLSRYQMRERACDINSVNRCSLRSPVDIIIISSALVVVSQTQTLERNDSCKHEYFQIFLTQLFERSYDNFIPHIPSVIDTCLNERVMSRRTGKYDADKSFQVDSPSLRTCSTFNIFIF